jgi:hypothetical protein
VTWSCERWNETSGSVRGWKLSDQQRDGQFLKTGLGRDIGVVILHTESARLTRAKRKYSLRRKGTTFALAARNVIA